MAKYAEAGVLYFNNPGNRPAGYTSQVLDPGSVTSLQTVSYINNRSGLKFGQVPASYCSLEHLTPQYWQITAEYVCFRYLGKQYCGLKVDPRLVGLIIHVDPKGLQRVMQGPELLLPPV